MDTVEQGGTGNLHNPDWVAFAESYVVAGQKVTDAVKEVLDSDGPFHVEAVIDQDVPMYFTPGLELNYPLSGTESADYL